MMKNAVSVIGARTNQKLKCLDHIYPNILMLELRPDSRLGQKSLCTRVRHQAAELFPFDISK